MSVTTLAQPLPKVYRRRDYKPFRWWIVVFAILIPTGILRFTGYNFQLPFRATDVTDERNLFAQALVWRGASFDSSVTRLENGYPPGIEVIDAFSLMLNEQWLHRATLDVTAEALATSCAIGTIFGLFTGVFLGLLG